MSLSVHQRIRTLIEQTSDAFTCCESSEADYAEFAALALTDFKNALENPHLTRRELSTMLRGGMAKHKDKHPDSWALFMAQHIAVTANMGIVRDIRMAAAWGQQAVKENA